MGEQNITLQIPTMYGDHHVSKVRQIVSALSGVTLVTASAAQQKIKVTFDPAQISAESITSALAGGGFTPGQAVDALNPPLDELRHVTATDRAAQAPESKFKEQPPAGVCPGLEPKIIDGEHPADR